VREPAKEDKERRPDHDADDQQHVGQGRVHLQELWSDLAHSNVKGSVQVSTLNTGNSGRDKHLKSADFFDIEKYPVMKFESNAIKKEGAMYSGKGALTIKGVTKVVTFIIDASETEIVFYTEIFASDFGVGVKKEREKNKVTVEVHVPLK
ncbi:MAG: YceI family protein, partial [Crocinitomicaceae bacterium]|nr:YceI family protein [Crocinitomicaceae bacterium]